jgi:hypothetical protein
MIDAFAVVRDRLNGLVLFGRRDVSDVAGRFERLFVEAERGAQVQASRGVEVQEKATRIAEQWTSISSREAWSKTLSELKDAMRSDIAG